MSNKLSHLSPYLSLDLCLPGYGGASCDECLADTYSEGGQTTNECTQCPDGSTTETNTQSTSIADCSKYTLFNTQLLYATYPFQSFFHSCLLHLHFSISNGHCITLQNVQLILTWTLQEIIPNVCHAQQALLQEALQEQHSHLTVVSYLYSFFTILHLTI